MLDKLILQPYLNNRFVAGKEEGRKEGEAEGRKEGRAEGRKQANEDWQAWYERMVEARERGEEFEEPPPKSPRTES